MRTRETKKNKKPLMSKLQTSVPLMCNNIYTYKK